MFPLIKEYTRSSIVGGPPLVLVDDTEDTQQLLKGEELTVQQPKQ